MKNKFIERAFILNPHASLITLQDAYHECFAAVPAEKTNNSNENNELQKKDYENDLNNNNNNQSLNTPAGITECFGKLSALIHLSLCDDFSNYPKQTTYHYHAVMSDTMDELRSLQQEIARKTDKEVLAKLTL